LTTKLAVTDPVHGEVPEYVPANRSPPLVIDAVPLNVPEQGTFWLIVNVTVDPLAVPLNVPAVPPSVVNVPVTELRYSFSVNATVSVNGSPAVVPSTIPV
jgi:hypothetical protein